MEWFRLPALDEAVARQVTDLPSIPTRCGLMCLEALDHAENGNHSPSFDSITMVLPLHGQVGDAIALLELGCEGARAAGCCNRRKPGLEVGFSSTRAIDVRR